MNKNVKYKIRLLIYTTFAFCTIISHSNVHASSLNKHDIILRQQIKETKISVNSKNKSLDEILIAICKQANMSYAFDSSIKIDPAKKYSLTISDVTVEQAINKLLSSTDYMFVIKDGQIIITLKKSNTSTSSEKIKVNGRVIEADTKNSIAGATVIIANSSDGAITDDKGEFVLTVTADTQLEISFVGYKQKNVAARGTMVIELEPDAVAVEDVIITGIYTRRKDSFTGSAASYSSKDLKMIGATNVLQSLKTLDPSFTMVENNKYGSDPNRLPDIEVRGKTSIVGLKSEFETDPNQPLFILDGIETTLQTVMDLNMDRVESITILKDAASSAIYGSKAANGVIVIETKRPEMGKLRVSYSGNYILQYADLSTYNLMNASEKLEFERLSGRYTDDNYEENQVELEKLYNKRLRDVTRGVDTYWLKVPVKTTFNHSHNIYAEGGDESMRYGIGLNYNKNNGVMVGSNREIIGGNIDLSYRKNNLLFTNKLTLNLINSNREPVAFSEFAKANPYYTMETEDGDIPMFLDTDNIMRKGVSNPYYAMQLKYIDKTNSFDFKNNFGIDWTIASGLKASGRINISKGTSENTVFMSPKHPDFISSEKNLKGKYTKTAGSNFSYNGDINIVYGKLFNDVHQVNVVGGWYFSEAKAKQDSYYVTGFTDDFHNNPNFANGFTQNQKPTYTESTTKSTSFYINANYSFNNRYLIDGNIRYDGNSIFGLDERFSSTWAVGLAWNIHNEKFMSDVKWINILKIRASMGNPGNQNFDAYQAYKIFKYSNDLSNMFGTSVIIDKFGNKDLEIQRTMDKNIGLDISFIDSRLRLNLDLFNKNTNPLLVNIKMPNSIGTSEIYTNFGNQVTKGITIAASYQIVRRDNFLWGVNANYRKSSSKYKNIGDKLETLNEYGSTTNLARYFDGSSPDYIWAVPSLGIDPTTGREMFIRKEDGMQTFQYSAKDEIVVGNATPKAEGVIGTSLFYKGFSLSVNLRYRMGGKVLRTALFTKVENIGSADLYYNQDKRALYDRWKQPGDNAKFKSITLQENTPMSSRFVATENTLSGESISFGYENSDKWLQKIGMQGLTARLYLTEIFRLSSFKEERGTEYPFARNITLSLSLRF